MICGPVQVCRGCGGPLDCDCTPTPEVIDERMQTARYLWYALRALHSGCVIDNIDEVMKEARDIYREVTRRQWEGSKSTPEEHARAMAALRARVDIPTVVKVKPVHVVDTVDLEEGYGECSRRASRAS